MPSFFLDDYNQPAWSPSYLKSPPNLLDSLAKSIKACAGKTIIGLSWRGGAVAKRIPLKSTSLEFLLPILRDPRYFFVSLQYGEVAKEIADFNTKNGTNLLI